MSLSISWEFANEGCGRSGGHLLTLNSHEQWINLVTSTRFFEKPILDYWFIGLKNMQVYIMYLFSSHSNNAYVMYQLRRKIAIFVVNNVWYSWTREG